MLNISKAIQCEAIEIRLAFIFIARTHIQCMCLNGVQSPQSSMCFCWFLVLFLLGVLFFSLQKNNEFYDRNRIPQFRPMSSSNCSTEKNANGTHSKRMHRTIGVNCTMILFNKCTFYLSQNRNYSSKDEAKFEKCWQLIGCKTKALCAKNDWNAIGQCS